MAPPADPPALVYVGFADRFAARLIDYVIHYGAMFGAALAVGIVWGVLAAAGVVDPNGYDKVVHASEVWTRVFSVAGLVVSSFLFEAIYGATIGKRLLGFVVLAQDGQPCGANAAWKRNLAYLADAFFFGLVGYLAMKKSPEKQRRGDEWAGTVVVKRNSAPPASLRPATRLAIAIPVALFVDGMAAAIGMLL